MEDQKIIEMLVDILEQCSKEFELNKIKGVQSLQEKIGLATMIGKNSEYAKLLDDYMWGNKYK